MSSRKPEPSRFRSLRLAAAALCLLATVAHADSGALSFDLPAQDMATALRALAKQANVQILFAADLVQGRQAPALKGSYTPDAALRALLTGSGLQIKSKGDGTFAVVHDSPESRNEQSLGDVVVTATRTERRIDEVPASVSVITAKEIRSQQVVKPEDLLRNVEGVDVKSQAAGGAGMVMLRGVGGSFAGQTTQLLVDGMPVEPVVLAPKGAALDFSDLGDIERIEVVRGPAAALYGPSAVGGVINIITKRWSGEPGGEVEVGAGSHNSRSVRAAVGGAGEKVDFRLSASDFRTDGFIAEPKPYFWQQQDLAGADWRDRKVGLRVGLYPSADQEISFGVRNYDIDSAFFGGRPNYRWGRNGTVYDIGYRLELGTLGDLRFKYLNSTIKEHLSWDGLVLGDPTDFTRYVTGQRDEYAEAFEAQANLRLSAAHLLTLGFSRTYGRQVETEDWAVPLDSPQGWDYFARSEVRSKTLVDGFFAQDEIRLTEDTRLLLGGRYDRFRMYDNSTFNSDNFGTDETRRDPDSTDSVFNPRVGVRHKLAAGTSLYASYGTAYVPALNGLRFRADPTCNSPDLKPETSASSEIGLNREWGGMAFKAAAFHTDYTDMIQPLRMATCTQYKNVGKVQVDGLELAIEGSIAAAWRTYANYTYNDSRIESNPANPASEGKRLNLVAAHKLNLGLIYAPSRDLTTRLSGRYVGDRYFDGTMTNQPDSRAAGYFVADFKISHRLPLGPWVREAEVSLAVNNLFDERYVEQKWFVPVGGGVEAFRAFGDRRNWWLGLRARF